MREEEESIPDHSDDDPGNIPVVQRLLCTWPAHSERAVRLVGERYGRAWIRFGGRLIIGTTSHIMQGNGSRRRLLTRNNKKPRTRISIVLAWPRTCGKWWSGLYGYARKGRIERLHLCNQQEVNKVNHSDTQLRLTWYVSGDVRPSTM